MRRGIHTGLEKISDSQSRSITRAIKVSGPFTSPGSELSRTEFQTLRLDPTEAVGSAEAGNPRE